MLCPYCSNIELKVVETRETDDKSTRRRRECLKCGKRFTTYERLGAVDLIVVKKDGRREAFDREKLKIGFLKACEKRPVSVEKIEKILDKIEMKIRQRKSKEVPSRVIGEEIMRKLKSLDKVAYIRFASVYRDFADVNEFEKELKLIKK